MLSVVSSVCLNICTQDIWSSEFLYLDKNMADKTAASMFLVDNPWRRRQQATFLENLTPTLLHDTIPQNSFLHSIHPTVTKDDLRQVLELRTSGIKSRSSNQSRVIVISWSGVTSGFYSNVPGLNLYCRTRHAWLTESRTQENKTMNRGNKNWKSSRRTATEARRSEWWEG